MTGQEAYSVLVARGVTRLFHANSVTTSVSQLHLGGLASRQKVEQSQLPQTDQYTDATDRSFGVWNDVFLDTVDIHARASRRNQYGPVLFELNVAILLNLPNQSIVLMIRSNPSKWMAHTPDEDRYFVTPAQLSSGLEIGNFDHMLLIRTPSGIIPISNHLKTLTLDEPRLNTGESEEYIAAKNALSTAAHTVGVQVNIARRNCASSCRCTTNYAEPNIIYKYFNAC